jgi:MFS family permease
MYGLISVASALALPLIGRQIDFMPLRRFSLLIFVGLILSVSLLSAANSFLLLLSGLFLVRFFGQGLMTHTSSTGIAKLFDEERGKALAFTSLGHPFAQLILPFLFVFLTGIFNWRISLVLLVLLSVIMMLPLIFYISPEEESKDGQSNGAEKKRGNHFLLSRRFWQIAVNIFVIPFLSTAIMLYQYTIADSKGWDASWVIFSFSFFAVFNGLSMFFSGGLIDRFSGVRLFPYYLLPALAGFVVMTFFDHQWIYPVFYGLLGVSSGLGSTIKTAVQAEVYGTAQLGEVRSYLSTIMVLGTAAGPPLLGYLLDIRWSMEYIMSGAAILLLIIFIMSVSFKQK